MLVSVCTWIVIKSHLYNSILVCVPTNVALGPASFLEGTEFPNGNHKKKIAGYPYFLGKVKIIVRQLLRSNISIFKISADEYKKNETVFVSKFGPVA